MVLNIYYKKGDEVVTKIYKQSDVYSELIKQYHLLKSIKAEFKLSILNNDEYLVKISCSEYLQMIAVNKSSIPYNKVHYLNEYLTIS